MENKAKKRVRRWTLFVVLGLVSMLTVSVSLGGVHHTTSIKKPKCRIETDHFARERMFRTCVASAKEGADKNWVKQCGEQSEKMSRYSVCLRFIGSAPPRVPPVPPMRGPVGGDLYPKEAGQ